MNLQYKWDIHIMTTWYINPDLYLAYLVNKFLEKNKINLDDCLNLKRFPHDVFFKNKKVQPWICGSIPILANILVEKGLEDIFDLAEKLKESGLDCTKEKSSDDYKKVKRQTINLNKTLKRNGKKWHDKWDSHKRSNQWDKTK